MPPSLSVPLAIAIFVVSVFTAFRRVGPRRAIGGGLIWGTLFLPVSELAFEIPLIKTKGGVIAAVLLAASLILDSRRWRSLRLRLVDLPAFMISVGPMLTSLANGLGAYDGASGVLGETLNWAGPYLLGRLYLGEILAAKEFAEALVIGGLAYVPLCLWEVRMSPQLHRQVFGIDLGRWNQGIRFGGYRPSVFLLHGLMLGMFLSAATLVAFWLWRTRAWRGVWGLSPALCFGALAVTTLLAKAVGAIALLLVGIGVLEGTRRRGRPWLIVALLVLPSSYCIARVAGWSGDALVDASSSAVNADRADSLEYRMKNENLLIERALQQPWLGWGGWGRNLVPDKQGDLAVVDGMWIATFGSYGVLGLAGLLLVLAVPAAALLKRYPARLWSDPRLAAPAVLAVVCCLWAIDDLLNAMPNQMFPAACGAVVSVALQRRPRRVSPPTRGRAEPVTPR